MLFVVDSMTGQDAANTAKAFNDALDLTGVILTKADGDARGGAALSVRQITGKPIKFIGIGEKIDGLSPFYPDRIAGRILGMGDVFGLIDDIQANVDKENTEKLAAKLKKGKSFNFVDYLNILKQMKNMGGVASIIIAQGCGLDVHEVNVMLREFSQQQQVMKMLSSQGGMKKIMGLVGKLSKIPGFGRF